MAREWWSLTARAFAGAGARVFLTARTLQNVAAVAEQIRAAGGTAEAERVVTDIANVATFLASDLARMITGVTVDVTAGSTSALNYKVPDVAFVER